MFTVVCCILIGDYKKPDVIIITWQTSKSLKPVGTSFVFVWYYKKYIYISVQILCERFDFLKDLQYYVIASKSSSLLLCVKWLKVSLTCELVQDSLSCNNVIKTRSSSSSVCVTSSGFVHKLMASLCTALWWLRNSSTDEYLLLPVSLERKWRSGFVLSYICLGLTCIHWHIILMW